MSREKKLVKSTIIITIGKVCTQLITFLLLPLYTGVLSTEEYGIVDLLNILVVLLMPVISLQIEQAVFRELIEVRNDNDKKSELISSTVFTVILQCIIFFILFIIVSPFIKNDYKIFLMTNVLANIFLSLLLQIVRGLGDNKAYSIGSFVSGISTVVLNVIFLAFVKLGATGMLLGTCLGQIFASVYLIISLKLYKFIKLKYFNKLTVKGLLKYSIPLIPNAISWWIFNASDKVIVSAILGVEQNGILSASLKFSSVYITFYNILNMSWTESIASSINDSDINEYFNHTFDIIMRLFTSLAVGMIACMPFVYPIMINQKFSSGYDLVPISLLGSLFNVMVGLISVVYIAKKNTKAVANISVISAIINVTVHLVLIRWTGLYAAVISTFVAFFIMTIYRIIDVSKKYFKINFNLKFCIISFISFVFVFVCYYINNFYLSIIGITIAIAFALYANKKTAKVLITTLIKRDSKKYNKLN